jgi:hypothetical protein
MLRGLLLCALLNHQGADSPQAQVKVLVTARQRLV